VVPPPADAADFQPDARFVEFRATKDRRLRGELVESHMGLAHHIAARYDGRGVEREDLRQVALLGLVKAVDRFDPERGVAFPTFAGVTIEGELKRHFRDATWPVKVPRRVKDLHVSVRRFTEELRHELDRAPTVRELAARLGVSDDEVIEALSASEAYSQGSLSAPPSEGGTSEAALGTEDLGLGHVVSEMTVRKLLEELPERERTIVELRFYEDLTQSEIAERVGLSQMHVSRLLRRSFATLRRKL
jgi:RNA polymerase sigma-B factor